MGMVANPFVLAAVKVIAYSAFGHQVEKRSEVRRNALIRGDTCVVNNGRQSAALSASA